MEDSRSALGDFSGREMVVSILESVKQFYGSFGMETGNKIGDIRETRIKI